MQHIYVADSDAQARREASAALEVWHANFHALWRRNTGKDWPYLPYDLNAWIAHGFALVGSPPSVLAQVQQLLDVTGANYFGGAFIFGSLTTEQAIHSLDLPVREVRPSLTVAQRASVPEAHTAYTTTGNA